MKNIRKIKCKDCYWYSDVGVKWCELDGHDPCDPESDGCSAYEPKDNDEGDINNDSKTTDR